VNGTVLVRAPSSKLAEGIVTHLRRVPVDVALARAQHAGYADALAASGWMIRPVPVAEECPDSVFIEDAVVVCEDLAVLARPGAPARRAEVPGVAGMVRSLGPCAQSRSKSRGLWTAVMCCRPATPCMWGVAGGPTARASASCARC
jgi:N-dimethylarginine dimethylaminohydrolase